jgi:6-hydroxycyclohex-1-ene-1-carbonyl-CoA dehydrogenase
MKAAVFHGPKKPLEIEEVTKPEAKPGEIVVKVAACGVCMTDLHYIDHGVPTFKKPPMILGHEPSGTVDLVGSGVKAFEPGQRVIIPPVFSCGYCKNCREGRENICENMVMMGNNFDGAYAEFVAVSAKDCINLPEDLPIEESSVIADALSTPYHAVTNRGRVKPGDWVAVFGCGGVGINTVQFAAAAGAQVVAIDIADKKLELARELGARFTLNPSGMEDKPFLKELKKMTDGGPEIAFEVIGMKSVMELAYKAVRTGGRLVLVGYTHEDISINAGRMMYREMEVLGSLGCRPVDYPKIIGMIQTGKIRLKPVVTHRLPLAKINDAFDLLRNGESLRTIVTP